MSDSKAWLAILDRLGDRGGPNTRALLSLVRAVAEIGPNPRLVASLGPAAVRGFLLREGKRQPRTRVRSGHVATMDWTYPREDPKLGRLYERALAAQWIADRDLDWDTPVDPESRDVKALPDDFIEVERLADHGIRLTPAEQVRFRYDVLAWLLSQFLHGEQGALLAATQVTETVPSYDAKLYGATQVFDEARHVEVFHRYLETKLEKSYAINDNLFTVVNALVGDPRWDMKFLGMQIMVEGLAMGAFGMLYKLTEEPLLKELLRYVIRDEARHVHFGVLALRGHFTTQLTERERWEREDWALEVAFLMRDRFLAGEVYEEWFEGRLPWSAWARIVEQSRGLREFRQVMFRRLLPNLREIGLLSDRVRGRYEEAGLLGYASGPAAPELDADTFLGDLAT